MSASSETWSFAFLIVGVAFAIALVIAAFAFTEESSITCVKAGGTWVIDHELHANNHCEKKP